MPDHPKNPAQPKSALTTSQEAIIIALSNNLLLPLNDLLLVAQEFLHPDISLSALANCLKKQKHSNQQHNEDEQHQYETFKSYDLGFIHINVEKLPVILEKRQRYLFIATDRATHWAYSEIFDACETASAVDFLHRLSKAAPFTISRVITEKSPIFTHGLDEKKPSQEHDFAQLCKKLDIQHLLTKASGSGIENILDHDEWLSSVQESKHFVSGETLEESLKRYQSIYNDKIPQINLGRISPAQALEKWHKAESETMRTKKTFKISGTQLLIIWVVWVSIALIFASQAMQVK
jgi:hypothetical protein